MNIFGCTKSKIIKDENSKNVAHLKITEVVLGQCNNINNDYQYHCRVLYTFILNKSSGLLLDISPKGFIFLKAFI